MISSLKFMLYLLAAMLLTLLLSPYLDQRLALLPYNFVTNKFYGEITLWTKVIYYSVNVMTTLLIVIPLIILGLSVRSKSNLKKKIICRMFLVTYLALLIGPGLVCNSFFKNHWGRARPYQVIRDHHEFSLPWQPHFDRPSDNSFPSGHVSIGAFIGVPFIAARRKRLGIIISIFGFILVGVTRLLQGGHYFSDIMMAALITWFISAGVMLLIDCYLKKGCLKNE